MARYENRLTLVGELEWIASKICVLTARPPQRALVNPMSFYRKSLPLPGKADPVSRRDLLYYSDAKKHRGYLGLAAMKKSDEEVREAAVQAVAEAEHATEQEPRSAA